MFWGRPEPDNCAKSWSRGRHLELLEPVPGQKGNARDSKTFLEHLETTQHFLTSVTLLRKFKIVAWARHNGNKKNPCSHAHWKYLALGNTYHTTVTSVITATERLTHVSSGSIETPGNIIYETRNESTANFATLPRQNGQRGRHGVIKFH